MFELVLYYKKRIIIGGDRVSIDIMLKTKQKLGVVLDKKGYDEIFDEYNKNLDKSLGREEIVDTWVRVDEDNFESIVNEIESDKNFLEWSTRSIEIIKQKTLK